MEKQIVRVRCPACGQEVEAVVWDGIVKGQCTVAHKVVNIKVEEVIVR